MVLKCGGPLVNTVIQSWNVGNKLHISRLKSIFWEDIKQLPQQNVFCRWIGETTSGSASVTKKLFLFFLMNTVLLSVLCLWRDCAENFLFRKKKHTSLSEPVVQNCISTSFVDISTSLHIEEKNFLLIFFFSHPWPSYSSVRVLLSAILSFSPNSVRLDLRTHPQSDINLFLARKQTKRVQRFLLKKVWWHCDKNERVVYALWCFFVWRRSTFLEMLAVSHTNTHTHSFLIHVFLTNPPSCLTCLILSTQQAWNPMTVNKIPRHGSPLAFFFFNTREKAKVRCSWIKKCVSPSKKCLQPGWKVCVALL